MSDTNKRLDEIFNQYYAPIKLPDDNRDGLKQAIKQLMIDEFEKLIGDMEYRETFDMGLSSWTTDDIKAFGRNELRIELRQKLEEWKK
jgi:hypothetical protein